MRSISPSSGTTTRVCASKVNANATGAASTTPVGADPGEHRVLRIRADCDERGCESPLQRRRAVVESHDAQGPVGRERGVVRAVLVEQQRLRHGAREGRGLARVPRGAGRSTGAISKSRKAKIPVTPRITASPPTRIARPAARSTATRRRAEEKRPARVGGRAGPAVGDRAERHRSAFQLAVLLLVDRPGERQIAVLDARSPGPPSRARSAGTP